MGRHSAGHGESFTFVPAAGTAAVSRRAARQAELRATGELPAIATPVAVTPAVSYGASLAEISTVTNVSRPRFSSFRSRAAVVAAVAAASGIGAVGSVTANPADATPVANTAAIAPVDAATATQATFTVTVDGQTRTISSSATTLYAALKDAGIVVGENDRVSQIMGTQVVDGAKVTITRVEKKTVTEDVADPHASSQIEDATLAKGSQEVQTAGVDGVTTNTYEVMYEDGKEVSRTQIFSSVKTARVDEVVRVGTKDVADESATSAGAAASTTVVPSGSAQEIAASMLGSYGWGSDQMSCLVNLWQKESHWNYLAQNRSSGAYGIPQALPGSKMASAGADWATNPATQIKWGLGYISGRYGSPCGAWAHSQSRGWY